MLAIIIGANDAGNVYALVAPKNERIFAKAVCIIFIFIGGITGAQSGILRISTITQSIRSNVMLIIAMTLLFLLVLTMLKIPVSASHTMYASIVGILIKHSLANFRPFVPILFSVIIVPLGSFFISCIFTRHLKNISSKKIFSYFLIALGGYALGANNLAVAAFPFYDDVTCRIIISVFMALGTLFSDGVSRTIAVKVALLDPGRAFSAQISTFISTYVFAMLGIPSSTSHAVIGSITGAAHDGEINSYELLKISSSWIISPILIAIIVYLIS